MTLHIHRSERADRLVDALGDVLSVALVDPFATEIVSVPTPGVERWLAQTLSHRLGTSAGGRDGVCAGVSFPAPQVLVQKAVGDVIGVDPDTDPWRPRHLVWPLLEVIERARDESWSAVLSTYLGNSPSGDPARRDRRWATARHLADLFATYAASRPQMIRQWLAGDNVDAAGQVLPPDRAWQAELWRWLRAELAVPSPAERLQPACRAITDQPGRVDLPERLSVFGATRLTAEHQAVLAALAAHREVHLWLTSASPALWQSVQDRMAGQVAPGPRSQDPTADLARHRLLGYLGRDSRELQVGLANAQPVAHDTHYRAIAASAPLTLLEILQDDLASDRPLRLPAERPALNDGDRSIQFHACHGPDRQVEVLRELLVGMLAADPTLEPRDIVVMCPDIETFAPLISAAFGLQDSTTPSEHPGHRLRVRLADRSLRQLNPLLAVLARVLALVDSRMQASALLDLCAAPPVARKFRFSEDDLLTAHDLVVRSGVRWGLDASRRSTFGMSGFGQNTWAAGLDRLLLGVTLDEEGQQFIGTALPLDDVESSDVDLVGRLAECIDRIRLLTDSLSAPRPVAAWVEACKSVIDSLTSVSNTDRWQASHAYAELGRLADSADYDTELSLGEVKALLADTFRGRPSRANFRTGTLTMCTMMPMRSIPHRAVCLLGVDDGVFPRSGPTAGDDILAVEPWLGDRDPRSEDRQLLLDAIMAAEEQLLVIYSGADPRTGTKRPPAVPIGELLDVIDLTAVGPDGGSLRRQVVTAHALQPFDAKNFVVRDLSAGTDAAFSFDRAALRGAQAAIGVRSEPPTVFDATDLPPLAPPDSVALEELLRFYKHPLKALMRIRAGLYVSSKDDQVSDDLPVTLDGLESWAIGDRVLARVLEGVDLRQAVAAEWRRGQLPPRAFGARTVDPIVATVTEIIESARRWVAPPAGSRDVRAHVGNRTVVGTCSAVHGDSLVSVGYSRLSAQHRLQSWLRLLALTVTAPDRPWTAVTIGRGGRSILGPVPVALAASSLADLVALYDTGLNDPLPFAAKTSAEYARLAAKGSSVETMAAKLEREWDRERDAAYDFFFGPSLTYSALTEAPPIPAEARGGMAERSRFGTLARRVFHPLLMSEELR